MLIQNDLTLFVVFVEGLLSFLSPCILPLIPVYISYLAGATIDEIQHDQSLRRTMLLNSFGFILGISTVFIILGAGASSIGSFFVTYDVLFRKVGAIIIIIFGLFSTGILKINFLNYERRLNVKNKSPKFINAFLLGATFSFGWTPCIGPILGSVLLLASTSSTTEAMFMLLVYSIGMTIPFFLTTLLVGRAMRQFKKVYKYFNTIKIISGVLLIIMGIAMYFDWLRFFTSISY
ncbi:cytochrome c biogenesis CcdA family protein [Vallitalea okinawensis]|uniref:cytochrome c biogenesis CcdA family protein n=1 Tax=Vallitalea okinawensis TaxID=2078660 RepID=UPI000CFB7AE6|nr:cytochrome c biogenesis CcdA family protein [Vallitalea okinawensis]